MFGWIKDFYKRHRKKIIFTSIFLGGTYVLSKYVQRKFEEWQEKKLNDYILETKKQYHFENNQRICTMTYMSFLTNVRNKIVEIINVDDLLGQLQNKAKNKREIWEELKIASVSQVICCVVSNVILLVFLKVELNIIAGHMFKDSIDKVTQKQESTNTGGELNEVQMRYLNNIRYFLEVKLVDLVNNCIKVVTEEIGEVSLKENISYERLGKILHNAKDKLLKLSFDDRNDRHSFCLYMVDPEWSSDENNDAYSKMTSETVDILESADCARVLNKCLENGFEKILYDMKSSFYGCDEDPESIVSLETCVQHEFYKPISIPLAKVVPLLNNMLHEIFKAGKNDFLEVLFAENLLREYSKNIYDAFSKNYP